MGSKKNRNGKRQPSAKLATDSDASHLQRKKQKLLQQQEKPEKMMPSISRNRCNPNSMISHSSIQKSIGTQEQDSQPAPPMKSVDLSPLVSIAANNNFELFQERNENTLVPLEHQNGLNYFAPENRETLNKYEFGEYAALEGVHNEGKEIGSAYSYDETFSPMIIDNGDDVEIEECAANYGCDDASNSSLLSAPYIPTNHHSSKAFCPKRIPRKSSIKSSKESTASPTLSIEPSGEKYEILLPGHSEPVVRQRSITFNDINDIQKIEPVRLLAIDGPLSLWYQESEYETIKFKTLALLDRVDHSSGVIDGKKYCTRGLEKFMTPEATEVKKHQAWDSVLNEQFLQRKDGEFDEETLANIYRYSTKRSKKEASKRAILDAEAAEAYLKTTFRSLSSSDDWNSQTNFNRRVSM